MGKRSVRAEDGSTVSYDTTVIASGQKKDCCLTTDGQHVVLWFREPLTPLDLDRLRAVVGPYRHKLLDADCGSYWAQLMCWPDRIIIDGERIGITAPRYRDAFFFEHGSVRDDALKLKGREKQGYWFASLKHRKCTLDPRELPDFRTTLRMTLRIVRAVRRLHGAGLVHGDLSYRNVVLDPVRGDACLIDLDALVVPGRYPPEVIGTPDFMAPEIVATQTLSKSDPARKLPDWHTDLHSLAVLVYLLLLLRHPLRGDQIHDLDDDERQETLLMGVGARFVEDPVHDENRINPDFLEDFELPWKDTAALPYTILGPYLSPLIERAFVTGLHEPSRRPAAIEWETALLQTANLLYPCSNEICEAGWLVFDRNTHSCPVCGTAVNVPVYVAQLYRHNGRNFVPTDRIKVLHHHAALQVWHLDSDRSADDTMVAGQHRRMGYIAQAEGQTWLVNEHLSEAKNLETQLPLALGQAVALSDGLRLLVQRQPTPHLLLISVREPRRLYVDRANP